uniref:Deleted in azoospermia-associated protein 2 n=1 Tax=Globodera pallida TaxID=36090 RepID=A0A183C2S2_GLOPA
MAFLNFLPPYVQQQSLYSSPPGIIPSSSPYSAVDLYQPNLPPQYTADQPYTLPTSSSPDLLVASPYRQQTLSPANGPFVMTLAEPPAFVSAATAAQQPPAGGYSAKVKSTKVLTTLVDKFKKDSKKNER